MFWKRFKKPHRVLGLSIHRGEIRWAEVDHDTGSYQVISHGSLDTGHPLWHYTDVIPKDLVGELAPLKAYTSMPVACVVPEEYVHYAYLSIPREEGRVDEELINEYINSYCAEHDDLVADDTISSYIIQEKNNERITIAATLCSEKRITPVRELLEALGFKTIWMVPYSHTMLMLHEEASERILIDIGHELSSVFSFANDQIAYRAALPVGRSFLLELIEEHSSPELAPRVYQRYGIKTSHRDQQLLNKLHDHMDILVSYVQDVLDEYEAPSLPPVIVTGDEAHMPGLIPFLHRALGQRAEHLGVWSRFSHPDDTLPIIDAHDRFRFAPALGATLHYFDAH